MEADPGSREWCRLARKRLAILAANLTAAGALCAAFADGHAHGYASCPCDGLRDSPYYDYLGGFWSPGCGWDVGAA
jgi:hypothetical protein